jgi:Tol biopolymer transport system component
MSLTPGSRVGPYEVVSPLGSGGMGEVFRARDARLKRDVALKVLPLSAVSDPDRRARFEREAQVLASLNHTNIAHVFGVEEADGAPVIVMELVEGPTLADRLAQGLLPIDEALPIAVQICDGLEAAHERGIIHRDLKPANIKVRPDGAVSILDFGLARVLTDDSAIDAANSPTLAAPRTGVGVALGTAPYMSPEQARARTVDKRTDIWAFGCVLYEMLTGAPAFAGESTTDVLAAVIQREPDLSRLPPQVPGRIVELLRRCLEKNPKDRLRDIADARFEIEQARRAPGRMAPASGPVAPGSAAAPVARSMTTSVALIAAGAAVGAGLLYAATVLRPSPVASDAAIRATINLPPDTTIALSRGSAIALSRDGTRVAFAGRSKDKVLLYVRSLDRFESQPIPGTEDAADPFFSPDGQWLGFAADGKIKKVSLQGGAPVTVADARISRGETWADGNTILLTRSNTAAVSRVSAADGKIEPLTTLGAGELSHRWPQLLPNGAVLFTIWNDIGWEPARIAAQRADGGARAMVVEGGGGYGRYIRDGASQGFLVYARSEGLLAARFDESRLAVSGQAVPIVDGVITNLSGGAHYDLSPSGTLAYIPGTNGENDRELSWVTLDGTATPAMAIHGMGRLWSLSQDGTRVLWNNTTGTSRDVFVQDLVRGTSTRLTNSGYAFTPIWSADGRFVIYERGVPDSKLYRRRLDGGADAEELISGSKTIQYPSSVSPDGGTLAFSEYDPVSGSDILLRGLPRSAGEKAGEPRVFVKTKFSEGSAMFSPDGHWLAYQSNESGRFEIYARSFPDAARTVQLTTDGGLAPMWSATGREMFYRGTDNRMKLLSIDTSPDLHASKPRVLFDASKYENTFGVLPDGRRLLMMPLLQNEQSATQIHIVLNVLSELRQRVK